MANAPCHYGLVVATTAAQALLEVNAARCASCPGQAGCQQRSLFRGWFDNGPMQLVVERKRLRVGHRVMVKITPAEQLKLAALAFGIPLILALIGLAIGALWGSDWLSLILALAGAGLGLLPVRRYRPGLSVQML